MEERSSRAERTVSEILTNGTVPNSLQTLLHKGVLLSDKHRTVLTAPANKTTVSLGVTQHRVQTLSRPPLRKLVHAALEKDSLVFYNISEVPEVPNLRIM